ncbi:MAG: peroxide stress protein YaaA, partial [Chloroflexota bacterium]|nr:peroxide stress protein YaaA [Chloroflexota bacterium]
MLILTPPSEGKSIQNTVNTKFSETNFVFTEQVKEILMLLKSLNENKIVSTYGTNFEKAKDLHKNNLKVFDKECSMAIERYTGVVFSNLDWKSLDNNAKTYLNKNLRIFSGMFG